MAEEIPEDDSGAAEREAGETPPEGGHARRRRSLTPEQRRFLNRGRSGPEEPLTEAPPAGDSPKRPRRVAGSMSGAENAEASRGLELQRAIFVIALIVGLGLMFFLGTKFNYIKYLLLSHKNPALAESGPEQFPGVAVDDLVAQALVAEHNGHWQDAVGRFMAAKRKNLQYRGILFRVGKILYDHGDFAQADKAFERALAFGENLEAASFFRGLIAVRTKNLTAAERFFDAAVTAAPFVPDYHYFSGETLRLDFKPQAAIPFYKQARLLARNQQDATVCEFKIRMARIEAAESEAVKSDLARQRESGPLAVDWLMTDAALKTREGHIDDARRLIEQAKNGNSPGLFASCANDLYFRDVAKKFPELADVLHLDLDLQAPFPD